MAWDVNNVGRLSTASPEFSIRSYIDQHLEPDDLEAIRAVRAQSQSTLARARDGDARLHELDPLPATASLSPHGALVAQSLVESVRAYLHYRQRDYGRAIGSLAAAFSADLQLEERGMEMLAAHRAQLVVNRMQISLRQGRPEEVAPIAASILLIGETGSYRHLHTLERPWSVGWDHTVPSVVLEPIRMLGQVVVSLVERQLANLAHDERARWSHAFRAQDARIVREAPGLNAAWASVSDGWARPPGSP